VTAENLKRMLSKKGEAAGLVHDVVRRTNTPIAVFDMEGRLLFATAGAGSDQVLEKHSIIFGSEKIGWASGGSHAGLVAILLTYLVARETEKEELLDEVLDLYRQVNLLYSLSDKLSASLELGTVANTILEEASRLITAGGGTVVLLNEERSLESIASIGQAVWAKRELGPYHGIVREVVAEGKAKIINNVRLEARCIERADSICSLLCAPLSPRSKILGAVVLTSQVPITYTAADLSLLNTLTSQAAPAIENALRHERALREAEQREGLLRQQILELRIELDEVRQQEKVAEITSSAYYQRLRDRADALRSIMGDASVP
jgi:transcriptional regulator with GAF, ATPase, and Fis domain